MNHELALDHASRLPLIDKFTYQNPEFSPPLVSDNTFSIFSDYFLKKEKLRDYQKEYISKTSLRFIDSIRAGFADHPEMVDRLNISSLKDFTNAVLVKRPSAMPRSETREAFDVALLTMGIMPEVAVKKVKDIKGNIQELRFSKRGILKPPETLEETRQRIIELYEETEKIGDETSPHSFHFLEHKSKTRTTLFFDVLRNISMRTEMQKDVEIKLAV